MKHIYLTGGAFGMIYQMGALSTAKSAAKDKYIFYGCSAGALTTVMTLIGYSDEDFLQIYKNISERALDKMDNEPYSYDTYNLTQKYLEVFELIQNDHPDAYKILTRKKQLHIGVTMETGFRWFKRFRSNEELFNCLLCSFHVPFLCSYNATINGVKCIDGGFGCVIEKHLPSKTLIICPKHTDSSKFDVLHHFSFKTPIFTGKMGVLNENGTVTLRISNAQRCKRRYAREILRDTSAAERAYTVLYQRLQGYAPIYTNRKK